MKLMDRELTAALGVMKMDSPLVLAGQVVLIGLWLLLLYRSLSLTAFTLRTSLLASSTLLAVANTLEMCYRVWGGGPLVDDPNDIRLLFIVGQASGALSFFLILSRVREGHPLCFWDGAERRSKPQWKSSATSGGKEHVST